jgi:hypothetical protein
MRNDEDRSGFASEAEARSLMADRPFCGCGRKVAVVKIAGDVADERTGKRDVYWYALCPALSGLIGRVVRYTSRQGLNGYQAHREERLALAGEK